VNAPRVEGCGQSLRRPDEWPRLPAPTVAPSVVTHRSPAYEGGIGGGRISAVVRKTRELRVLKPGTPPAPPSKGGEKCAREQRQSATRTAMPKIATDARRARPIITAGLRSWPILAGILVACASGCDLPGRPRASDRWAAPQSEKSFDVLFRLNCAGCHGADGKLGPAPPLNDKLFLALVPDDELKQVVANGRPGTLMPAFSVASGGQLTAEQVLVLAEGIKHHWGPVPPAQAGMPAYRLESPKPDRSDGNAAGMLVFAMACASCHGERGQGRVFSDEAGGKPSGAINVPAFLTLYSDQALRRLVITGRPDLGMPDCTDRQGRPDEFKPLTSREVTDLVALLASWREGAGADGRGD
jgi:cytochrome c oxidase cbb3-type subunit III